MIRMHDKAAKFLNDVHKKKIGLGNKIDRVDDSKDAAKKNAQIHNAELSNNCYYCHKVFISPKFLLKHILRRHPEDLISLHRKCLKPESNKNSSDIKGILDFLQAEFSELRNELKIVKQVCVNKVTEDDDCNVSKQHELSSTNENCNELKQRINGVKADGRCNSTSSITGDDTRVNEMKLVKEKFLHMESNIQCLHKKFVELDAVVKSEVLSKKEIHSLIVSSEDKILKAQEVQLGELRCNLLKNLNATFSGQLQENNAEWKSQVLALNRDVQRLDHLIDIIKKQINSPDHLAAIEKNLEKHIVNFMGISRSKRKASKERNSKLEDNSSVTKQVKGQKRSGRTSKVSKYGNTSKTIENANKHESACSVMPNELSYLLVEKMAHFGIPPGVSKLSDAEYEEKIKLINSDKEYYNKKWPTFSDICDKWNTYADQKVIDKLKKRKCRKLRFSEPTTSEKISIHSSHENFQNKTYPILNDENHKLSVCNADGSNDSFWNFKELQLRSKQPLESTSIKEYETFSSIIDSRNFQVENTKSVKDSCLSSMPFSAVKKVDYASLNTSKEQLDSGSAKLESLKFMGNNQGFQAQNINSLKNDCLLPFDTDKKKNCASVEVSELDSTSDDSVVPARETCIKYPKNFDEDDGSLVDGNSSLTSLSSWESYENANKERNPS